VNDLAFHVAYVSHIKSHSVPLKLLVENELFRLSVWSNPVTDSKRGIDYPTNLEKSLTDVSHF
jgi:phosphatidylinositol 4-kinase